MLAAFDGWGLAGFASHLVAAAILTLGAGLIMAKGDRGRPDRMPTVAAMWITAAWCVIVAAYGPTSPFSQMGEVARNTAWIIVSFQLFKIDGRDQSLAPIRPVVVALIFVELLQLVLLVVEVRMAGSDRIAAAVFQVGTLLRLLVSVGSLVLLHNLFVGAGPSTRVILRWSASALAAMWAFELNLFTVAYLGRAIPVELLAFRGLVTAGMVLPLVLGMRHSTSALRLMPSRTVTFQTLSLLAIGAYLLAMVGVAQSLSMLGGDFGRLTQVGFTVAATALALLWLPSHRLRGWLRVTAVKHLFQHRYDYRAEWMRFNQTIGKSDGGRDTLHERAIKAMADITDSPGGLLFLPGEDSTMELASRWAWSEIEVPPAALAADFVNLLQAKGFILDIDDIRQGNDHHGEVALAPQWLTNNAAAWALVPLVHFDRLAGIVLLARPQIQRRLDWEDFDLLRVVGSQLASYLSEQAGQQALMEAARFDEFNRRIAFVMHDIKNLASQLALLARNAEKHADNPEFRADMLVTLRSSADKLNTLLARLNRYGSNKAENRVAVDLGEIAKSTAAVFDKAHPVVAVFHEPVQVMADPETLSQALVHLVQNGIDATQDGSPVYLNVSEADGRGRLEIVDSGCGMNAEFVRDGLFKPFVSSKAAGFGIGAFEARDLIQGMGGRLDVDSREGLGTRFIITMPLVARLSQPARQSPPFTSEVA